jgi:mycofactocin system creatininase family protein
VSSLADLASPDVAGGGLLVVPVGATEQHGPHLPLTTDTEIAVALAQRLAAERPVTIAPALAYGSSGEHAGFAGTLSIGQEAIELVLLELGRSAAASFARLLLISTHGGNAEPVRRAAAQLRREGHEVRAWSPYWGGDAHAGRSETSLMLALAPDRVRVDRGVAGATAPIAALLGRLRTEGLRAVSVNGVLGDPTGASAAEGRALLARVTAELVAVVDLWA